MESLIASRRGVQTVVSRHPLSVIFTWMITGAIKSAEWNRPEVAKRNGNDSDLMASIIQGFSIGLFIGFYNGKLIDGKINPTKQCPIQVTEGGHRLRWLMKILGGETVVNDMSIKDIQSQNPELYGFIMDYKIIIEIKTHVSGEMSEKYMRAEYNAVNTHSELLKPGETRSIDDNVDSLCDVFDDAFKNRRSKTDAKAREAGTHLKRRIIASILSNDFRHMATNNFSLPKIPHESTRAIIDQHIRNLGAIESENFERSSKKVQTKMMSALDDKIHPVMFYGLVNYPQTAGETIKGFYAKATENESTYTSMMDKIKKKASGSNGGDRFTNSDYFSSRWRIVDATVNPVSHDESNMHYSETI